MCVSLKGNFAVVQKLAGLSFAMNTVEKYWNSNLLKLKQKFPVSWENLRKTMPENRHKKQIENKNEFDDENWNENIEYSETICKEKETRYFSWQRIKAPRPGRFSVLLKKCQDSDSLEYGLNNTALRRFTLRKWKSDCHLNESVDELQVQLFSLCPSEPKTVTFCEHNIILKSALKQKKNFETGRKTKSVRFSVYALLLSAASENAVEELKQLIQKYPEYINRPSSSGDTVLHRAVSCGHLECVHLLVEHGANMLNQNFQGQTPLSLAWKYDYNDCLNYMLKASGKFES